MKRILFILFGLVLSSCSVNILTEFSNTTSDAALFFEAKQLVNDGDYAAAINKIAEMSSTYQARREVKVLAASAYLGLCSPIDFIELVEALDSMGATRLFPWLFANFIGGDSVRQDNCVEAENALKSIDIEGVNRNADENLLMAFVSFAKMGAILTRYADAAPTDGVVDAAYDPCDIGALPSADAKELTTGFLIAIDALQNIGGSTVGSAALGPASTACGALCTSPPQADTADIDATEEKAVRSLINEDNDLGLGSNCSGDVVACACP